MNLSAGVAGLRCVPVVGTDPPGWVGGSALPGAPWQSIPRPPLDGREADTPAGRLISVKVSVIDGRFEALRQVTASAYRWIGQRLSAGPEPMYPVRFWGLIPGILEPAGEGVNRYMAFNAGRHDVLPGLLEDLGLAGGVAATGVGAPGDALVIHCLAAPTRGAAIENTRQIPAYRYSRRYGPKPPVFARATRLAAPVFGGTDPLLISGTASVVGEDSIHAGDLDAQLAETHTNLQSLLTPGGEIRSLRAYVKRSGDVDGVLRFLSDVFPQTQTIEWQVTDLCRPELLVEVEGTAALDRSGGPTAPHRD